MIRVLPYRSSILFNSDQGILFANFLNTSLQIKLDSPNCYKGIFDYDSRCRFFYISSLDKISIYINPPKISITSVPPYISQLVCQRAMYFNPIKQQIENNHVTCLELMLSNINNYFQNIINSSKQYYVIEPRTLEVFYNSKKKYDYSTMKNADNFYDIELQYLEEQDQAQQIMQFIKDNYNTWVFSKQDDDYVSFNHMFNQSKHIIVMDYKRNGTMYKAIFNPVVQFDQIPKFIAKYTQQKGLQLEYAYLSINIISDEDLKLKTNELLSYFSKTYIIIQISLVGFSIIVILINAIYAIQIKRFIYKPLIRMTKILEQINQLKELVEISQIIQKYEHKEQSLVLPKEIYLLYQSFLDLFKMIMYTSENFFEGNEGEILINLSQKVDFFNKFKNYAALGLTHNNLGNILLKQEHYFQALEHFSLAIMYARYEITLYQQSNQDSQYQEFFQQYSYAELQDQKQTQNYGQTLEEGQLKQMEIKGENQQKERTKSHFIKQIFEFQNKKQEKEQTNPNSEKELKQSPINQSKKQQNKMLVKQKQIKGEIQELVLGLFFRQQNQIITLIAFQEHLNKKQNQQKYFKQFQLWKEIKKLVQNQINLVKNDPELQYLNVFMNCLISKCYYKRFQYFKAKQRFLTAQQILDNLGKNTLGKFLELASPNLQANFFQKQNSPSDETQRQNYNRQTERNQQSPNLSYKLSHQKAQQKTQNKINIFNLDLLESVNETKNNQITNKDEQYNQISLDTSQRILINKKQSNQESQNFSFKFKSKMNSQNQSPIQFQNNKSQNFQNSSLENSKKQQNIQNSSLDNTKKQSQNNLKILIRNLNQYVQFSLSEYFTFTKKYKKAAEILTDLYESNTHMASNMPFRIVYKLKEIFDTCKIQDTILYEEYSRFNKNLSIQLVISFQIDNNKENFQGGKQILILSSSKQNEQSALPEHVFQGFQTFFLQQLLSKVLIKNSDKVCLFSLDSEEQLITQITQLIDPFVFKHFYINQLDRIKSLDSNSDLAESQKSQKNKQIQSQNIENQSLNFQQISVSQYFNQIQQEKDQFQNQNMWKVNQEFKKFFISDIKQSINLFLQNQENNKNMLNQQQQVINKFSSIEKQILENEQDKNTKTRQKNQKQISKVNLHKLLQRFKKLIHQFSYKIIQKEFKAEVELQNFYFYNFILQALDQLISKQYTYKIVESQLQNYQFVQSFDFYKQFMSHQLGGFEQEKPLKFIIYQINEISLIQEELFQHLCQILYELNIKILMLLTQKVQNTPQQRNQSYYYQNKEVIKTFYNQNEIVQYLIFKRNSFSKFTQYSYVQYY